MKTPPRKTMALLLGEFSYELEIHIIKMGNFWKFKFLLSFYYENFCPYTEIERHSKPIYTFSTFISYQNSAYFLACIYLLILKTLEF